MRSKPRFDATDRMKKGQDGFLPADHHKNYRAPTNSPSYRFAISEIGTGL